MAGLTLPFSYDDILIGEEIIWRAFSQQQDFAANEKYGMTWTDADELEKSGAFYRANLIRSDFSISVQFQYCLPYPPCHWPKESNDLNAADIKPAMMHNDGAHSFAFDVYKRTDSGNSYTVGEKIMEYTVDQNALDPTLRNEFSYFKVNSLSQYTGLAIFIVRRYHRGTPNGQFQYLFDLK